MKREQVFDQSQTEPITMHLSAHMYGLSHVRYKGDLEVDKVRVTAEFYVPSFLFPKGKFPNKIQVTFGPAKKCKWREKR